MAFGDTQQSASNSGAGVGVLTVTFVGACANSIGVAGFAHSATITWSAITASWIPISKIADGTGNMGANWYYKVMAGGETSVTACVSTVTGNMSGVFCEFIGPWAASVLDVFAHNLENISASTTSISTCPTGTTSQADELAVAFFAADNGGNVTDGRSYSNTFIEQFFSTSGARASSIIAKKILSATGAVETTFTTTDTGDEQYGAVAVFRQLVAAGGDGLTPGMLQAMTGITF